ncbi:MAG: DNA polymerase III subunit alpha [Candidatus Eisenbacteria bacterium]|nr:DNA polymerase III subunit alpha [Candidatus Eisenbacteria bacterium]
MQHSRFVHLHNHTGYSLLDGACKVGPLVEAARAMKMPALAVTDHGNMFGAIEFYGKATKAGLKPIIGCEVYVARGSRKEKGRGVAAQTDHLVLLASSDEGYRNLLKLVSVSYLEGFYYTPRIDKEILAECSRGLIGLSACLSGEVARLAAAGDLDGATSAAGRYSDIFGKGNFYVELQNHGLKEQLALIPSLKEVGRRANLPVVATNDCHYIKREDSEAHDVLLCVQTGKTVDDADRMKFDTDQVYFKSAEEMLEAFKEMPEACAASLEVADKCNLNLEFGKMHLPHFPLPEGYSSSEQYLKELAEAGLRQRYADVTEEMRRRLEYELETICKMGFAGYFLVVRDFIVKAREMGVPVGPGRGSAAGSLVSYCLRITDIDPLRFGLLFERFLNPERISMPDIDIDFGYERRSEVIDYVKQKYGTESVTQIITFGTLAARAVVRDVGRALNISYAEVDGIAKLIPAEPGMTLEKALQGVRELREIRQADPRYEKLIRCALTLEGLPRHPSTHAAGVLIAPGRLTDYVPLFKSSKEEVTTQYDMKSIEKIGLLKMDLLGLRTLTVIDRTVERVNRQPGRGLVIDRIPLDDEATYGLFGSAHTVGIFQVESAGMRELLRRLRPGHIEDIIAVNALHRPGPLQGEMVKDFIDCKLGKKKIKYLHPILEPILKDTHGVILYQEQVLEIAHRMAGFSLAQADILRRAMGKKMSEEMDAQRRAFLDGSRKNGISGPVAERVFDLIASFAGYGFNKSHSTAYAMLSYRTAYLKVHHPREFMAASLTSEMSDTDRVGILVEECRRMGITMLPSDVSSSEEDFTVTEEGIRFGLGAVRNVGSGAIRSIVEARKRGGPFRSIHDLVSRVDQRAVNRRVVESLVCAGACDCLPGHRAQHLSALTAAFGAGQRKQRERDRAQASFFDSQACESPEEELPEVSPWPRSIQLAREKEMLGFYLTDHPLAPVRDKIGRLATCDIAGVAGLEERAGVTLIGVVSSCKVIMSRNNRPMAFVGLEDFSGTVECVVFSDLYESVRNELREDTVLLVRGKKSSKEDSVKIVAREVEEFREMGEPASEAEQNPPALDAAPGAGAVAGHAGADEKAAALPRLEIELGSRRHDLAERVKTVLAGFPGLSEVVIAVPQVGNSVVKVRSRSMRVNVDRLLLDALRELVGPSGVRVWWPGSAGMELGGVDAALPRPQSEGGYTSHGH